MVFKEVNSTGLYVALLAIICFSRNIFFPEVMLTRYSLYPFRMNGNFIRCSNSYFSSKGKKPFHRMLFFNLLRVTMHEIIKEMMFKGRIIVWEVGFVSLCCVVYTIFFHFMPLRVWRYFRFVWAWLLMEYYTKHSADLINNRNELERLGAHNFCAFLLFMYIETNSNMTPAMLEGFMYGNLGLLDLPYLIYDSAFNYFIAVPLHYILQIYLMGASLKFHIPTSLSSAWYHSTHIEGY